MKKEELNPEQAAALEKIKRGGNYVILGNAGTGKSALLRHLRDAIPDAVYAAPTGAAARLIGGATLNSLFRIPPYPYITAESIGVVSSKSARKAKTRRALTKRTSFARARPRMARSARRDSRPTFYLNARGSESRPGPRRAAETRKPGASTRPSAITRLCQ